MNLQKKLVIYLLLATYLLFSRVGYSQVPTNLESHTEGFQELSPSRPSVFDSSPYVEAGYTYDGLTNNYANWNSEYLNIFVPLHENGFINAQIQNANRYGEVDQDLNVLYAYPFSYGVMNVFGGGSANGHFLPQTTVGAEWNGRLPQSFGYIVGVNQKQFSSFYSNALTNAYNLGLEKYIGEYRLAYVGNINTINRQQEAYASKIQIQWVGSSNNRLGFTYAWGREPIAASLNELVSINFSYAQIDSLYWLNKTVGITTAIWHGMEGAYYQRNGFQIGIRVNF
jgi:YaiO family outer membrane protein